MANMAEGFLNAGHEVSVISSRPFGQREKSEEAAGGVKILRFFPFNLFWIGDISRYPAPFRLAWHIFDVFNLSSFLKVRRLLKKEKPDLVITNNLKGFGYLIPLAIKSLKLKNFHVVHDVQLSIPSGLIIKGKESSWEHKIFLTKTYEKINRLLFSFPEAVISPSRWLMDFYSGRKFFKNQKKVILPNPYLKSGVKKDKAGDGKVFNFLYVGQIEDFKGILFLIDSFKKLKKDYMLTVVGDGSKLSEAKKISAGNKEIKFLGRLKNEETIKEYEKSDMTIVPSLCYENSPTVIYESLSVGTPVLASEIGGVGELVYDGVNGYKFRAGDADDLLEKINYCLDNRDKIREMRSRAVESVSGFALENYISKIMELV